jgi:hypothetical protein
MQLFVDNKPLLVDIPPLAAIAPVNIEVPTCAKVELFVIAFVLFVISFVNMLLLNVDSPTCVEVPLLISPKFFMNIISSEYTLIIQDPRLVVVSNIIPFVPNKFGVQIIQAQLISPLRFAVPNWYITPSLVNPCVKRPPFAFNVPGIYKFSSWENSNPSVWKVAEL